MASTTINIKIGSEKENCYRLSRILYDVGADVSRKYVTKIIDDCGYTVEKFFEKYSNDILTQFKYNKYFDSLIRTIKKHPSIFVHGVWKYPIASLNEFDIGSCAAIIENMIDPKRKNSDFDHPKALPLYTTDAFDSLYELRRLRNDIAHLFTYRIEANNFLDKISKIESIFTHLCIPSYSNIDPINEIMDETIGDLKMEEHKDKIFKILIEDREEFKNSLEAFSKTIDENNKELKTCLNDIILKLSKGDNEILTEIKNLRTSIADVNKEEHKKTQDLVSKGIKEYEILEYILY
jgi:hypothetical protein